MERSFVGLTIFSKAHIPDENIALLGEDKEIFLIFLYDTRLASIADIGDPTASYTDFPIPDSPQSPVPSPREYFCYERGDYALTYLKIPSLLSFEAALCPSVFIYFLFLFSWVY